MREGWVPGSSDNTTGGLGMSAESVFWLVFWAVIWVVSAMATVVERRQKREYERYRREHGYRCKAERRSYVRKPPQGWADAERRPRAREPWD